MLHNKFDEVRTLVDAAVPVMLTGERGSGKTTLGMQVAKNLKLKFYGMSMTRQTTLSHLLGFINVNGVYVESQLYKAATEGGLYLMDEIDAADANVLLSLNTIENGYLSFPTGVVELHKDFRLMSTSNPHDQHQHYVGRNKLDAATLDRFDIINIPTDPELEKSLVTLATYQQIELMRKILKDNNSSIHVSMRDTIRYQKRKDLGLADGFETRIFGDVPLAIERYREEVQSLPEHQTQEECQTVDDLFKLIRATAKSGPAPEAETSDEETEGAF